MKILKVIGIVFIILFMVIIGLRLYIMNSLNVPGLKVYYGDEEIEVYKGSYCWSGFMSGKCVDTVGFDMMFDDIEPIVVSQGDKLDLVFTKEPNDLQIQVQEFGVGSNNMGFITLTESLYNLDEMTVPNITGNYIIVFYTDFDGGRVPYGIKVEIVE